MTKATSKARQNAAKRAVLLSTLLVSWLTAGSVSAEQPMIASATMTASVIGPYDVTGVPVRADALHVNMNEAFALGVIKYDLDHATEVIGWRVRDGVYFGSQDGDDSGLSIVWQQQNGQVSLSKDGLRLTRRF